MKKSVNAWAVSEKIGFEETFAKVKAAGFDAIELNLDAAGAHSVTMQTTVADCEEIFKISQQQGLPISGLSTSMAGNIASDDPAEKEQARTVLLHQIQCAKALQAPTVLTVPGAGKTPWGKAQENCVKAFSELKDTIEKSGIMVGVEHVWNGFFLSPRDLSYFVDSVNSPNVGVYFDIGNCADRSNSEDWISFLGKRIIKVHIKNFKRISVFEFSFIPLYEQAGTICFQNVMKALKEIGYDDVLTAEYGAPEGDPAEKLFKTVQALEKIVQGSGR